ncbi:MAG TPA: hypothetical protein VNN80_05745 [Polyangiaceae bacterium]|nr:hypothetical protein [Polyangiaceae bacterium]
MSKASIATLWRCGALVIALASATGCKKDEPPPPLPEPAKVVETAEKPLELKPEDAGPPVQEKAPPKPTARKPGGIALCCAALRQNAINAPEPNKTYMLNAATACDMAAAVGKDKSSIVGQLTTALKGAGLPADCK